eukprot:scaffold32258_cov61-Cyclotella_meneghiniana.AAC.3
MARPKQHVDWEEQLASIIERSDRNLSQLNSEFNSVKSNNSGSGQQTVQRLHVKPTHTDERVECRFERAAHDAFNTAITRPSSRSRLSDDELMRRIELKTRQTIERALNDKLTSTSRAIDALRDQICGVTDEIRELNTVSSQTKRSISKHERRLDVICHDVDTKRGALNDIEAHVANEISILRKELTSSIESSKRSHKTAMISSLRGTIQNELDKAIASIKDTIGNDINLPNAVKEEISTVKQHLVGVFDSKIERLAKSLMQKSEERMDQQQNDTVEITKAIIIDSVSELEKNLSRELTKKLEAKSRELKNDILSSTKATKEDVMAIRNDLSLLKDTQPSAEIDDISTKISELDARMNTLHNSQGRNDADIMSAFDYLSQHKELIKAMSDRFVTREVVENIVDEKDNIFDGRADNFVDTQTMKSELDSIRLEIFQHSSTQSSDLNGKLLEISSTVESLAGRVESTEKRADAQEDDFKRRLNVMLDVVESFEERVQNLEDKSQSKEMVSEFQEALSTSQANIMVFINDTREQTKTEVALLRNELASVSQQLSKLSHSNAHADKCHQDGIASLPENLNIEKDDDNLSRALTDLHTTLIDTKNLGNAFSQFQTAESIIASEKTALDTPSASQKTVEEKNCKPDVCMSPGPCVHLLGLGSPGSVSVSTAGLPVSSPGKHLTIEHSSAICNSPFSLINDEKSTSTSTEPGNVNSKGTSEAAKETNDANTPRSESTSTAVGSILTEDALSLCGDIVNLSYRGDPDKGGPEALLSSRVVTIGPSNVTEHVNQTSVVSRLTPKDHDGTKHPNVDSSSIAGSIASFDEIEVVSNSTQVIEDPRHGGLTFNIVDNEVYAQWEFVLAELTATISANRNEEHNVANESGTSYESSFESED